MRTFERLEGIRIDYILFFASVALLALGLVTMYSASNGTEEIRTIEKEHVKQFYWAIIGCLIFIVMLFINYQKMGEYAFIIYATGIILLVVTLLIGKRVRGARSWITLFGGFGFQPSEFVKIAIIVALARFLERVGEDIKRLQNVLLGLGIVALPTGLILLQPDFGTALVYMPIALVMLYFAGIRYIHLISLSITFGLAISLPLLTTFTKLMHASSLTFLNVLDDTKMVLVIALLFGALSSIFFLLYRVSKRRVLFKATNIFLIFFAGLVLASLLGRWLKPYQKTRLVVFFKPTVDPYGAGYNIIQSKIAVGAGGIFGKGLLGGTQSQLGFLPEKSTDFIFSIFAEEWGFFGSIFLLGLYVLLVYRGITIILNAKESFGSLLAAGIVGMFLFHIIVNIGMTIGIMPITGIPLPFMSYGGSFLLTCMVGVSILFNIEMRRYQR